MRCFGDEVTPFVVSVRDGGGLVGLMPLVLSQRGHFPTYSFGGAEYGDYYQPVSAVSGRGGDSGAREFAKVLGELRNEWAIIAADYMDEDAPWTRVLASSNAVSLKAIRYRERPNVLLLSIPLRGHRRGTSTWAAPRATSGASSGASGARSSSWAPCASVAAATTSRTR